MVEVNDIDPHVDVALRESLRSKRWRAVLCFAMVSPLFVLLFATTVKGKVGKGFAPYEPARDVWVTMSNSLPDVSNPGLLTFLFWVLTTVFLAGFVVAVWYALAPSAIQSDEPNDRQYQ